MSGTDRETVSRPSIRFSISDTSCMQDALRIHPEWNGDWEMPANVRKAEVDIRNGSLIRELDSSAQNSPTPSPSPKKTRDPNMRCSELLGSSCVDASRPMPIGNLASRVNRAVAGGESSWYEYIWPGRSGIGFNPSDAVVAIVPSALIFKRVSSTSVRGVSFSS